MMRLLLLAAWGALAAAALMFCAWAVLALHYAPLAPAPANDALAASLVLVSGMVFWRLNWRRAALASLAAPVLVLAWFLSLQPTNDAAWQPEYAVIPAVTIDGGGVRIDHIRNFAWHGEDSATPGYFDAQYDLASLASLDLIVSHWSSDAIAHVFVSFGFRDGRHLAFSVETRRRLGQQYSVLGGFFRNYELFYAVADERDLIGVRTDQRHERVYLYKVASSAEGRRRLLLSYLHEVQSLALHPQFYNTLTDNCTTSIAARVAEAGGAYDPFNWKLLLSGYADSYVYDLGRLDQSMPFADLKRRSRIQRVPDAQVGENFSQEIRNGLP
jgi:hypothetical protein